MIVVAKLKAKKVLKKRWKKCCVMQSRRSHPKKGH